MASETHVKFNVDSDGVTSGEDTFGGDNHVKIQVAGVGRILVHLGFLQINHRYEVIFDVPREFLPASESVEQKITEPPNLHCRLTSIEDGDENTATLTVDLVAHKEKLQKESIILCAQGSDAQTEFVLQGRVLGRGKGTPSLKIGVRCTEVLRDPDDSDAGTDWKGFD